MGKRLRKLAPDLTHAVLGHPAYGVREVLPSAKDKLELAIARKFVRTLNERFSRQLSEPRKASPPGPDCLSEEGGRPVGIELIAVTTEAESRDYQKGQELCDAVRGKLGEHQGDMSGVSVEIWRADTHQQIPGANSQEGQRLAKSLAGELAKSIEQLRLLKVGRWTRVDYHGVDQQGPHLTMVARRYAPLGQQAPFQITLVKKGESPETLTRGVQEAVGKKLQKHYELDRDGTLILVLYERFWFPRIDAQYAAPAQQELQAAEHPFDEVWYFFPVAKDDVTPEKPEGFLRRLWPV